MPGVGSIIRISFHGTDMVHDFVFPFSRNIVPGKDDSQILPHWIPRSALLSNPVANRFRHHGEKGSSGSNAIGIKDSPRGRLVLFFCHFLC
eukprot:scaffold3224_cov158-Amphora_coffeaeformis.AAC.12